MERPHITLNMAQSLNGYISGPEGKRVLLSSKEDRVRVMEMRKNVDAIVIGRNTVMSDNPELLVEGNSDTIRVVIDPELKIYGKGFRITDGSRRTIVLNEIMEKSEGLTRYMKCHKPFNLKNALEKLYQIGIKKILVEGGKKTAESFLREKLVDEMYLFVSNIILPDGGVRMPSVTHEGRNAVIGTIVINGGVLMKIDPGEWV
ncbi:RibD family protein [Cuniculiplasma sp. SKW3]|uniref:RibD family protein n=1 Tax=unclassified Cuniculiplasma TaxID=2619706 RepID=UPI003FD3C806